uniref:ribosomal protein L19 n=1 Tax=Gayralia brasiliensis TaxID=1286870 RepID=UPI0024113DFF|nr:ribosomal protein L19 [Gayralia brasiliensis]YP_010733716.1 ribosomal protein L19 [Monostroma nitidum]WEG92913.1 ribosomal protein L19 [Gayralia brasiliensis]WEG92987.1 ribosomal protein L19 [Monostroma nitidum]
MKLYPLVKSIESDFLKKDLPVLRVGNQVIVNVLIQEANKKRIQAYQGTIISQHRAGLNSTITVRRISKGIEVKRIFPLNSPDIDSIQKITSKKERISKVKQ